jgi:hypothetical protein
VNDIAQAQTDRYLDDARRKNRSPKPDQPHMVNVRNLQEYRDRWDLLGCKRSRACCQTQY